MNYTPRVTPMSPDWAVRLDAENTRLATENRLLREKIADFEAAPAVQAAVVAVEEKRVVLATGNQVLAIARPKDVELSRGALVYVRIGQNPTILGLVGEPVTTGNVHKVTAVLDDGRVEVDQPGAGARAVAAREKVKKGDRVVLDLTGTVVVSNLGQAAGVRAFRGETGVRWEDVVGQAEAKRALVEAIVEPATKKDLYRKYAKRTARGALLWGPPGNGKTMLGKAAATAIADTYGAKDAEGGFIYVKGPELLNMFVGGSEGGVRAVFADARAHKAERGYPAIVFVDEADALLGARGRRSGIDGMERTVVPQFLSEMDGLEDAGAFVLLATNRPDTLDPAVVRDERISRRVEVAGPTRDDAVALFRMYLREKPLDGASLDDLAAAAAEALYSPKHALYVLRTKDGKGDARLALADLVSGAMVAGTADRAVQLAIRDEDSGKGEGVSKRHVREAAAITAAELRGLDHSAAIRDFAEARKLDVAKVDRA